MMSRVIIPAILSWKSCKPSPPNFANSRKMAVSQPTSCVITMTCFACWANPPCENSLGRKITPSTKQRGFEERTTQYLPGTTRFCSTIPTHGHCISGPTHSRGPFTTNPNRPLTHHESPSRDDCHRGRLAHSGWIRLSQSAMPGIRP